MPTPSTYDDDNLYPHTNNHPIRRADPDTDISFSDTSLKALKREFNAAYDAFWRRRGLRPPEEGWSTVGNSRCFGGGGSSSRDESDT